MGDKLRERALRLLARREHTRFELSRKLAQETEDSGEIERLLDELVARGLVSDARCAEIRVNSRSSRFGNARLVHELRTLGVADDIVGETLAASEAQTSEIARARIVWQRRFGVLPSPSEHSERARQARFLMNRGFSGDTVRRVLRGDFEDE